APTMRVQRVVSTRGRRSRRDMRRTRGRSPMYNRHLPIHLRLVAWAMPQKWWLALSVFTLAGASLFTVATPKLVEFAIDTGLRIREQGGGEAVAEGTMGTILVASALLIGAA